MHSRSLPRILLALVLLSAVAPRAESAAGRTAGQTIRDATGLRFKTVESIIRRNIISTSTPYGFKIKSVDADSPAARAGLRKGDVLLEWDAKPIKSRTEFSQWLDDAERGKPVAIRYARLKSDRTLGSRRPWKEIEGTMTLGEQ